ncbi:PEP/pyruvate-binding domain-containing protein [Georgenia sp. AZ-5]|uniref:PEP/pyruvate-binding domain-containing protein n=1 Tax=Georgenia sp. AZ-5 TaxID=3367526 RepID=UPI003754E80A
MQLYRGQEDAALACVDEVRAVYGRAGEGDRHVFSSDSQLRRLAVLVQPMVAATAAGVAFTTDPLTGDPDVTVVEAVSGVGESLVSGARTPEVWEVRGDRATRRSGAGGEVLAADAAAAVAALARGAAHELGGPQDVEWALENGGVRLLQARPITTLAGRPVTPVPIPVEVPPGYWERDAEHAPVPDTPFNKALFASITPARAGCAPSSASCSKASSCGTSAGGSTPASSPRATRRPHPSRRG